MTWFYGSGSADNRQSGSCPVKTDVLRAQLKISLPVVSYKKMEGCNDIFRNDK